MGYGGMSALTHPAFSASSSAWCWHICVLLKSLPAVGVLIQLGLGCADRVSPSQTGRRGLGVIVVNLHFANSPLFTTSWIVSEENSHRGWCKQLSW